MIWAGRDFILPSPISSSSPIHRSFQSYRPRALANRRSLVSALAFAARVHFPLSAHCCLRMEAREEQLWAIASKADMTNCNMGQLFGARRLLFASERCAQFPTDFDRLGGQVKYGGNAMSLSPEEAQKIADRVQDESDQDTESRFT